MKIKIYSRFNTPPRSGILFTEPTLTQQHFKHETNINNIVSRAIATKNLAIFTPTQRAQYYDCTVFSDYQDALDRIADIEDDFSSLPSSVRKEFGNDVDAYVSFMTDPANVPRAIELGLLEGVPGSSAETQTPTASSEAEPLPAGSPEAKSSNSDA